ncbi:hypothetical protein ABZT03_11715 [Streptomyces sp. NPDC005574]|uniref:hypothetical protein n=1 Tax=Streptomyces sp. NPDC005574 TaxID=3156891 RepID=UPI0033B10513
MASYVVTGKTAGGAPLFSVSLSSVDQDDIRVEDIEVVNAVRKLFAAVPGVGQVEARKFEQVITVV